MHNMLQYSPNSDFSPNTVQGKYPFSDPLRGTRLWGLHHILLGSRESLLHPLPEPWVAGTVLGLSGQSWTWETWNHSLIPGTTWGKPGDAWGHSGTTWNSLEYPGPSWTILDHPEPSWTILAPEQPGEYCAQSTNWAKFHRHAHFSHFSQKCHFCHFWAKYHFLPFIPILTPGPTLATKNVTGYTGPGAYHDRSCHKKSQRHVVLGSHNSFIDCPTIC